MEKNFSFVNYEKNELVPQDSFESDDNEIIPTKVFE